MDFGGRLPVVSARACAPAPVAREHAFRPLGARFKLSGSTLAVAREHDLALPGLVREEDICLPCRHAWDASLVAQECALGCQGVQDHYLRLVDREHGCLQLPGSTIPDCVIF